MANSSEKLCLLVRPGLRIRRGATFMCRQLVASRMDCSSGAISVRLWAQSLALLSTSSLGRVLGQNGSEESEEEASQETPTGYAGHEAASRQCAFVPCMWSIRA